MRTRPAPNGEGREETGASVRLWLTGDKHHYMRFAEELDDADAPHGTARQLVTCGLGGAFLEQTHGLADSLELLPTESRTRRRSESSATFRRVHEADFPSVEDSRKWVRRLAQPWSKAWGPRRNPGQVSAFGIIHLVSFLGQLFLFGQGADSTNFRIYDRYLEAQASVLLQFAGAQLLVAGIIGGLLFSPMLRRRPPLMSPSVITVIGSQWLLCLCGFVGIGLAPTDWLDFLPGWILFGGCLVVYSFAVGVVAASLLALCIVVFPNDVMGSLAIMGQAIEEGKGFLAAVWPKAEEFGFPDEMAAFGLQFGHGLGLALHERPIISRLVSLDQPMELKPGMVFALETYCPATDGFSAARIEEEVVVTDKGCTVITRFPAEELPIANRY